MIRTVLLILYFTALLITFGCSKYDPENKTGFTIIDDLGNEIHLDKLPVRIVSLAPSITESMFAIGADSLLVGITNYCNYPEGTKLIEKVGGLIDPNIEIVAALRPDLVLITVEGNSKGTHTALNNAGLKVFTVNPRNIEGIKKMILKLGDLTGKKRNADIINNQISDKVSSIKKDSVILNALILVSLNPYISVNKSTYINELIELSGFYNIYKEQSLPYPTINPEDIPIKNPEIIFLTSDIATGDFKSLLSKTMSGTSAYINNKIFILNADIISRPGPRITSALDSLIKLR